VRDGASLLLILFICGVAAAFWRQILAALAVGALVVLVTGAVQILNILQSAG
jgi:hypothetical protein